MRENIKNITKIKIKNMVKFEHLEGDVSNLPKNLRDFKKYIPDITDTKAVKWLFEWYANHSNVEVSDAAKEVLAYFRSETLKKLGKLDNKEQKQSSLIPLQIANNESYQAMQILNNKGRKHRNINTLDEAA